MQFAHVGGFLGNIILGFKRKMYKIVRKNNYFNKLKLNAKNEWNRKPTNIPKIVVIRVIRNNLIWNTISTTKWKR